MRQIEDLSFDHHRVKQVKMRFQVVMTKLGTTLLVFTFDRIQSTDLSDLYTVSVPVEGFFYSLMFHCDLATFSWSRKSYGYW